MSGPSSEQAPRSRILAVIFINTIMIISCTSIAILHKTETLSGPAYALGESEWRLRQLTVNGGISASISGDGSRVAFISNPNGQYPLPTRALSVINMDGTGFKQLINTTCGYPSINRDGSRITFNTLSGGNWQVCVINSDGTGFKQLTSTELNYYPSISGDGSKVVFIRDRDIYVINSDGTGLRKVTTNLQIDYSGFESCPSISGNGSRIAFHAYSDYNGDNVTDYCDIFVVNSDGTGLRRLTNYANARLPSISYDGAEVAFVGDCGVPQFYQTVYTINSDGTGLRPVTSTGHDICISGNGDRLAFTTFVNDSSEIFSIFTNSSDLKELIDTPNNYHPSINYDGSMVVFESRRDDRYQIMISFAPQSAPPPRTWTVGLGGSGESRRIQDAVNAASPGDIIEVLNGVYAENVVVRTDQLTIHGQSNSLTIVQGSFLLSCDYTSLSGFRIEGMYHLDEGNYSLVGVDLRAASFNLVMDNYITDCASALMFNYVQVPFVAPESCENNTVVENNIVGNQIGVWFNVGETNNKFYHNYFINNRLDVDYARGFKEIWDNGYPSGGNYWDKCTGPDSMSGSAQNKSGSDGLLDTPYVVATPNTGEAQIDHYPLANPWSKTLHVPRDYSTIQEAVDHAGVGNTIIVGEGIYNESIQLNKDYLTIRSENGSTLTIIQAASPNLNAITVTGNFVNVSGFTVRNAYGGWRSGILLSDVLGCDINHNDIAGNCYGIGAYSSNTNTIRNNKLTNNVHGIHIFDSSNYNLTINNRVMNNSGQGIYLLHSSSNTISNNTVLNCIYLESSNLNLISNNTASEAESGIELTYSSQNNSVISNTVSLNHIGLVARALSNNNVFVDNIVQQNDIGFRLGSSNATSIYHNCFVSNKQQVTILNSTNLWDNGYPSGGNNWSDYIGVDMNHDGIGDFAYVIDASNIDRYPFIMLGKCACTCSFTINLGSSITLFVTDPLGRSFGINPESGQTLGQIPNTTYFGGDHRCILVISPLNGSYSIQLRASTAGSYTLTVELSTPSGTSTKNYTNQVSTGENQAIVADVSGNLLTLHQADPSPWTFLYVGLIFAVLGTGLLLFLRWMLHSSHRSFDKISGDEDETVVY